MLSNLKSKAARLALATPILGALLMKSAFAADITLTASATDVSEVTGPFTTLLLALFRGPVAQFMAVVLVLSVIMGIYWAIRRKLGKPKLTKV